MYLITNSLISSWQWYYKSSYQYEAKAKEDFLNHLNRIRTIPNENCQRGIDYENKVQSILIKKEKTSDPVILEIVDMIQDSLYQTSIKKEIRIADMPLLLYGRTDWIKKDIIYDLKNTKQYKLGKYLNSFQHRLYMYITDINKFQYLISTTKELYIEEYYQNKKDEQYIINTINSFFSWLKGNNLYDLYLLKWKNKY